MMNKKTIAGLQLLILTFVFAYGVYDPFQRELRDTLAIATTCLIITIALGWLWVIKKASQDINQR